MPAAYCPFDANWIGGVDDHDLPSIHDRWPQDWNLNNEMPFCPICSSGDLLKNQRVGHVLQFDQLLRRIEDDLSKRGPIDHTAIQYLRPSCGYRFDCRAARLQDVVSYRIRIDSFDSVRLKQGADCALARSDTAGKKPTLVPLAHQVSR